MDADNWRDHATLSAREAFAVLGISLAAGYAMMQRGDIPYIRASNIYGRRWATSTRTRRAH